MDPNPSESSDHSIAKNTQYLVLFVEMQMFFVDLQERSPQFESRNFVSARCYLVDLCTFNTDLVLAVFVVSVLMDIPVKVRSKLALSPLKSFCLDILERRVECRPVRFVSFSSEDFALIY
jgi:hypothetical protein